MVLLPPPPPEVCLTTQHLPKGGGSDTIHPPAPRTPPPPSDWDFLRVVGQSKFFFGAFGASQFRPKSFFGTPNNNSGSPGGGSPPQPPPPPRTHTNPAGGSVVMGLSWDRPPLHSYDLPDGHRPQSGDCPCGAVVRNGTSLKTRSGAGPPRTAAETRSGVSNVRRRVYPDARQTRRDGQTRGVALDQVLDLRPTSDRAKGPWLPRPPPLHNAPIGDQKFALGEGGGGGLRAPG